ncbi:PucR family transcriptional regulator [Nocardia sp. NPDC055002]
MDNYLALSLLTDAKINLPIARSFHLPEVDAFTVIAMSLSRGGDSSTTAPEDRCHRIRHRLSRRFGYRIPSLLTPEWATVLVPATSGSAFEADELVSELATAAGVPVTSVALESTTQNLPDVATTAHELLDVAVRLRKPPCLYRFEDLAVEYQVTRPGPGRDQLVSLLAPLDASPELLHTLIELVSNQFDRKKAARRLYVHPNTVDYRLKHIARLTGLPLNAESQWRLYAALVASSFASSVPILRETFGSDCVSTG